MKKINYEKVVLPSDLSSMGIEKFETIASIGRLERRKIKKEYVVSTPDMTMNLAKDFEVKSKFQNLSPQEMMILQTNCLFDNNDILIRSLIEKGYSWMDLYQLTRLVSSLKKISLQAKELEADEDIKVGHAKVDKILTEIARAFLITNCEAILTKISEIVAFDKELYNSLNKTR